MATGNYSSTEWQQLINAPQLIHHVFKTTERGSLFGRITESRALKSFLKDYKAPSPVVQSIIDAQEDVDDKLELSSEEAQNKLQQLGTLIESRSDNEEGNAIREFLVKAGEAIAKAERESLGPGITEISAKEKEALESIATALKATEADKLRRREAATAAAARQRAAEQAKRDADAKAKREAEAQKTTEEARAKHEAEAQAQIKEMEQKRHEAAKKAEEERAARKAAAEKEAAQAKPATQPAAKPATQPASTPAAQPAAAPATQPAAAPAPQAAAAEPEIYVVKKGDTLSGIAKQVYGKAGRWPEIFEANKDRIENPNLIRPGWKLRIPR